MFCQKCGKELGADAKFCDGCGAPAGAPQAAAPQAESQVQYQQPAQTYASQPAAAPAAPNPMFTKLLDGFKSFFSKNVVKGLGNAAKSTTHEWAILAAAYVIFFALAVAVNIIEYVGSFSVGAYLGHFVNFGTFFGLSLVVALVANAMIAFGIFFQMRVFYKKKVSLIAVFNMVEYASIPVIAVCILNLLLGLIWTPLIIVFFACAVLMQIVLLYAGVQKFEKLDVSPFYGFSLVGFVCIAVILAVACLLYQRGLLGSATSAVSSLTSLF